MNGNGKGLAILGRYGIIGVMLGLILLVAYMMWLNSQQDYEATASSVRLEALVEEHAEDADKQEDLLRELLEETKLQTQLMKK